MNMSHLKVWRLLIGVALTAIGCRDGGGGLPEALGDPATRPAPATAPAASQPKLDSLVATAVREALGRGPLAFSTGAAGPERYEFMLTMVAPLKDGGEAVSNYAVARDGDEVAVLVLSSAGAPYAYATNGLLVGFDPTEPGRLLVYGDGGAPSVWLGVDAASKKFRSELSYRSKVQSAAVDVDVQPVLAAAIANLELATFDPRRRVVKLSTRNSIVGVFLPPDGEDAAADAPLRGLIPRSKGGPGVALSNVRTRERSSILGRARVEFERLGIPVRVADDKAPPKFPLFVPPAFGRNDKEKQGIERMIKVFPDVRFEPAVTPSSPLDRDVDDVLKARGEAVRDAL